MDERRLLAHRVLVEGRSLSGAAREAGVCRNTARLWVSRARESGLAQMREEPRRPSSCPWSCEPAVAAALTRAKGERPFWGAKKLLAWLWPDGAPVSLSTANRVLRRAGLTARGAAPAPAPVRFERALPNELWQADFKGLGKGPRRYEVLSVVDDATRFCVALLPLPAQTAEEVWRALWGVFGDYGLPQRVLTDNGHCFTATASHRPGSLEPRLWRLGVATSHGRPGHPQTQGKVERFHRTLGLELGERLRQPGPEQARAVLAAYRDFYNWERPHEALGMGVPGARYRDSERARPEQEPRHEVPAGACARTVDKSGKFRFKGHWHRAGHGLAGEKVELRDTPTGPAAFYAGVLLDHLDAMRVVRKS